MVEQIGREREMENLNKCPVNNSFGQEESEAISQIRECQNSVRLTGDKETDGNIIAFYRAKESFLAKQK